MSCGLVFTVAFGVALGIIFAVLLLWDRVLVLFIAALLLWDWAFVLMIAILALVAGAVTWFFVLPAVATDPKVTSENPDTALAYWSIVTLFAAIAIGVYFWLRHRKSKKREAE